MQQENIPQSIFRERLTELMASSGDNQVTLAAKTGIKQANISRYMKGRIPKAEILHELAVFFGVSVDSLLRKNIPQGIAHSLSTTGFSGSTMEPAKGISKPLKKNKILALEKALSNIKAEVSRLEQLVKELHSHDHH